MKRFGLFITIVLSAAFLINFSGCASAIVYGSGALGKVIKSANNSMLSGGIDVTSAIVEKVPIENSVYQKIKITGKFKYTKPTGGNVFFDMKLTHFVFKLELKSGGYYNLNQKPVLLSKNALIESIETDKEYDFFVVDSLVPANQWEKIETSKYEFQKILILSKYSR